MKKSLDLSNKSILITGGTGSLGKALTSHIFKNHPNIKKLIIWLHFIGNFKIPKLISKIYLLGLFNTSLCSANVFFLLFLFTLINVLALIII